MAEKYVNLTGN